MSASSTGRETIVYEKVLARRDELTRELREGQEMLAELEAKRAELQQTLLRISGAVQVLNELIDGNGTGSDLDGPAAAEPGTDEPSVAGFKSVAAVDSGGSFTAAR
jgi:hypothetical protein